MRLYFVRHGESEANIAHVFSNQGIKHPLTARGRAQVEALAEQLKEAGIAAILSSPLLRATESAALLAERLGVPSSIEPALVEYDVGIYEGQDVQEGWDAYDAAIHAWVVEGRHDERVGGGESFAEIERRFVPLIEQLVRSYGASDQVLALVGHGGTYRLMLPLVLANIAPAFAFEQVFYNTAYVLAELRGDALVCLRWCDQEVST